MKTRIIQTAPDEPAKSTKGESTASTRRIDRWKASFRRLTHRWSSGSRGRNAILVAAVLGCLALALAGTASASLSQGNQRQDLQRDLDALVAGGAPGAILFVRGPHGEARLASGLADIARSKPMQPNDRYRIASLAKSYTATVVLQLVAEGKLTLGDTVEQWLPGVIPSGADITVRMLLNHTSGVFNYEFDPAVFEPYFNGDLDFYWSPLELIAIANSHAPLYAPGQTSQSTYSNTNYAILGLIVKAVTGRSIEAESRSRIFLPLHLAATTYPVAETTIEGKHARGYFMLGAPPLVDLTEISPSISGAGGAIVSTVADVAEFYRALFQGRLLPPNLLAAMKTTIPSGGDLGQRYGLGLEEYETQCGTAWGHSGSFPGYLNYAFSSEDGKHQAVLMINADPTAMPSLAGFYDLLFKSFCSTS